MIGTFRKVIANEGAKALLTGVGPTFAGYFLQGAFKFGGYEFFKQQAINQLGYESASNNRTAVYLASAACAEFFADIALCPLEATRIRLVSQPTFATGLVSGFGKIAKQEGFGAFYSGFGPILFKQVPYTMAKFVVYEKVAELMWQNLDKTTASDAMKTSPSQPIRCSARSTKPRACLERAQPAVSSRLPKSWVLEEALAASELVCSWLEPSQLDNSPSMVSLHVLFRSTRAEKY
jgi:Mitochondrial carrier protein